MRPLPSLACVTVVGAGLLVALGGACGGKSYVGGEPGEAGSTALGGSSGSAGTSARAGRGGSASSGAPQGGASKGGSGTGGKATAGAGGSAPNEACGAPFDPGPCNAYFESWYHDPSTGICRPSVYGGCGGNANRYESLAACQKACPLGAPNHDSCTQAGDCVLRSPDCCGLCDTANLTLHSFISYSALVEVRCGSALPLEAPAMPGAGLPSPGACAPCAAPVPGAGNLQYFVPECVAGQCSVTDVRTSPATACMSDDECTLRRGARCCEVCDENLLAVRKDGSFEQLVCGGSLVDCASCEENPATGAMAVCAGGRCRVAYRGDTLP